MFSRKASANMMKMNPAMSQIQSSMNGSYMLHTSQTNPLQKLKLEQMPVTGFSKLIKEDQTPSNLMRRNDLKE